MAVAPSIDRPSLGGIPDEQPLPDLIEIQTRSYNDFLQWDVPPDERAAKGLQEVFLDVFPIASPNGQTRLEFVHYSFTPPKYTIQECQERGMTYAASLKALLRLVRFEDVGTGSQTELREKMMLEQEVFLGELPIMTPTGTFIINGAERVIVSQLHKSPGVSFEKKIHQNGKTLLSARIIPYRGAWLEFEYDVNDTLWLTIDRRSRLLASSFLKAFGYVDPEQILALFYRFETVSLGRTKLKVDGKAHDPEEFVDRWLAVDAIDPETGEVLGDAAKQLTLPMINRLLNSTLQEIQVLVKEDVQRDSTVVQTLSQAKTQTEEDALREIYARIRPGDPATDAACRTFFQRLFFDPGRYDFAAVGRYKINRKLGLQISQDVKVLSKEDVVATLQYPVKLRGGGGVVDDIDHLGNRRVRAVGELMENQYRIGLVRMERAIKERMSMSQEIDTLMPHDLINAKPVSAVVKEYFGSSQLSQFMDQTNPLSEVTHKRRLSALGPGGLTRERAGFEVRDVHATHYGRICPIETPEGPNIGLIASLSTYARVNEYGFVETPYRKVVEGKVLDQEVRWYSALEEEGHYIAQANAKVDPKSKELTGTLIAARYNGESMMVMPDQIELMDVSPNQLVSVAASLIPFLEHDDANRALMGSNMQRQAVPCLRAAAPIVGTGIEDRVARDSGVCIVAKRDGVVDSVDATRIVVKVEGEGGDFPDIYRLNKFQRSNQSTCYNQQPIVRPGDKVKAGDVIADGPSTDRGELALGQNVVAAFMPWGGYNFEDSILISERIAKDDVYTSVHIEEFECVARDTKLGKEEITRDIPNVGEEALKDLDESGIVRIGAEVKSGDILVGKITPKSETQLSPEEKLLRAIFGEKAGDVRDTSLRVPPGVSGIVIDARVFARKDTDKDDRAKQIEDTERAKLEKDMADEIKIIRESAYTRIKKLLLGRTTTAKLVDDKGKVLLAKGVELTAELLDPIIKKHWGDIEVDRNKDKVDAILAQLDEQTKAIESLFQEKIDKLGKGDELPPGVIKMVKVYLAIKRKLQVGDKMAGRHGNKGVVSRILPEEDLPFLPDGTPVDIVLNPLGVPSRMNVGQILEVHLGWAGWLLGRQLGEMAEAAKPDSATIREKLLKIYKKGAVRETIEGLSDKEIVNFVKTLKSGLHLATPVFDGATEEEIRELLELAGVQKNGQTVLFDGRTGEAFHEDVTVGVMYVLKLHHLVDDKIHARSIGPYSLVTQQPLGGKAQFGGQRFGEMEVWALEAYGAAYCLQEL
ncbi:MAG: DNA-directed RNA polymerase subunit beta, partial [Trueperaceae bacterium]|nr:DNA-directed RNA polymerase subunit beta [Trueperaceae bacterium]